MVDYMAIAKALADGTMVSITFNGETPVLLATSEDVARGSLSLTYHKVGPVEYKPDGTEGVTLAYLGDTMIAVIRAIKSATVMSRVDHL